MALSGGGSDDSHDIMASLAARLRGNVDNSSSPAVTPKKSMTAAAPRFVPAAKSSANETVAERHPLWTTNQPPAPKKENLPPSKPASPLKTALPTQGKAASSTDNNTGPSLFGSADQLAVSPLLLA